MLGLQSGDPEQIGPYLLLGRLGQDDTGLVFLGQSADGRPVAVTVIRPDLAADSEFRARFRRKVTAAKQASGASATELIDADEAGPQPWLARPYVAGAAPAEATRPEPARPEATRSKPIVGAAEGPDAGPTGAGRWRPGRILLAVGAVAVAAAVAVTLTLLTSGGHPGQAASPAHPALTHPSARPTPDPAPLAWSAGQRIGQAAAITSISCPAATFCLAADAGGKVYGYSGGRWSGPRTLTSGALTSVSCATASFCAATGPDGRAYVYTGGHWSAASQLTGADGNPADLKGVSCPATGFCVAAGKWDAYTYSAGQWAGGHQVQQTRTFASISCPTTAFCLAVDSGGNVYGYSGGRWSGPRHLTSGALTSVSCATASFCAATGPDRRAYVYAGGSWSASSQLTDADGRPVSLRSVSCPAAGHCLAVGTLDGYLYSGGTWAAGHVIQDGHSLTALSCPAARFCLAADSGGDVYTYSAS